MNDPSESSEPEHARSRLSIIIALSIVVALCALLAWWLKPPPEPAAAQPAVHIPPDAGPAPRAAAATSPPERPRRREPTPEAKAEPAEIEPPAHRPPTLRVTSDVAGAFVFVDRKFLGKTPLETERRASRTPSPAGLRRGV